VSHSAKLSHTVGKSWLFFLKASVADGNAVLVPLAEKLLGATTSVGTVENNSLKS